MTHNNCIRSADRVLLSGDTALVPLGNRPGYYARVDLTDFQRLQADGYDRAWFAASNGHRNFYVRMNGKPGDPPLVQLARIITGAGPREVVRHADGDHLNLTRRNLKVIPRAKHLAEVGVTADQWGSL